MSSHSNDVFRSTRLLSILVLAVFIGGIGASSQSNETVRDHPFAECKSSPEGYSLSQSGKEVQAPVRLVKLLSVLFECPETVSILSHFHLIEISRDAHVCGTLIGATRDRAPPVISGF